MKRTLITNFYRTVCLSTLGMKDRIVYHLLTSGKKDFNTTGVRCFSERKKNNYGDYKLSQILNKLFLEYISKDYIANRDTQMSIEKIVFDEYNLLLQNYRGYSINNINLDFMSRSLKLFILNNEEVLLDHINNFMSFMKTIQDKNKDADLAEFLNKLDEEFIHNLCLLHFILLASNQDSEDNDKIATISVTMDIGRKILKRFLFLYKISNPDTKDISYSEFYITLKKNNIKLYNKINDDSIIARLGSKIIEILESCNMIKNELVIESIDSKYYKLTIDKSLLTKKDRTFLDFPFKLPMIVKPNPYSPTNLGGYLLNDLYYSEDLIVNRNILKEKSVIESDNIIYDMINNINSIPYKINRELLDYLLVDKHKLLIDVNQSAPYEEIEKKTKYQLAKYKAYISKLNLQQNILGLADFYSNFPCIYFPIKMDHRGRIYCANHYLNYQSSDLAKALLLFSNPGIINKKSIESIKYLEYYGVNCFGKDKISDKSKSKWIKDNLDNILNYDNGILLNKAKEKLLFLAFCMEYKRYIEFVNNEEAYEFKCYLPVQLDASCNGFQHLAMLSHEKDLFKELNLIKDKNKDRPNDFYNFLVYKLNNMFDIKIDDKDKDLENYKRLKNFTLDRGCIKKAIMTIPYNASHTKMRQYIISNLYLVNPDDKLGWYSKSDKNINPLINNKDISILVSCIYFIIHNDFIKIKKLMKYLKNVATVLTIIGLPIVWSLPNGLTVNQSYLEVKSTSISPYLYSKRKLNIQVVNRENLDKGKQARALMPNLIHSLDATSLALLYTKFNKLYNNPQFLAVHDCFGTTPDKVYTLKTLLASVYMEIYSNDPYLDKFDQKILTSIEDAGRIINKDTRTVTIMINDIEKQYQLHDINWVKNKENIHKAVIKRIDSQYLLI